MSSEDHDNSATALLQPASSESDQTGAKDEDLVSLTEGEQPIVDQATKEDNPNNAEKPEQDSNVEPPHPQPSPPVIIETPPKEDRPTTPPVEIKIENETEQPLNSSPSSEKPAEVPVTSETVIPVPVPAPNHDVENPKDESAPEDEPHAGEEGDKVPIAPKPSRTSRLRSRLRAVTKEEARMVTSIDDIGSLRLWKGVAAEFIGTMLLTMVGCGSCVNLRLKDAATPVVQIALCFGLSVATIVWAIGHVSGGHINPAVTMAMLATRKISLAKAAFFVIFQLAGAILGAALLYGMTPSDYRGNLGATLVNSEVNVGQAVGVEIFITFVLVFVVFASVDSKRKDLNGSVPLTIGLSVTMCHLFAVDYTGSSMNTARSFGPAVVAGKWNDHWVYWLGPILGGIAAGLLYDNLFAVNASLEKAKACLLSSDYDDDKYQAQKMRVRILEEDPEEPKQEGMALNEKSGPHDDDIPYIDE